MHEEAAHCCEIVLLFIKHWLYLVLQETQMLLDPFCISKDACDLWSQS